MDQVLGHPYACIKAVGGGIARCRNLSPCSIHASEADQDAPLPDTVLLKINLSKPRDRSFTWADVRRFERSLARSQELGDEHERQAQKLGRNAFVIREKTGSRTGVPEDADSGSPVFGPNGVQRVRIEGLIDEFEGKKFRLTGFHSVDRHHKPPVRLVMQFSYKPDESDIVSDKFPWGLYEELITATFGQVHVWANPIGKNGCCVHTVNLGKRENEQISQDPEWNLRFNGGYWSVDSI